MGRMAMRRLIPTVLLCGFAFCGAQAADAPGGSEGVVLHVDSTTRRIELREAESLLEFPEWLTTVKSSDATVVHVSAVRPNRLRVQRVTSGTTHLMAVDRSEHRYSVELIVRAQAE